MKKILLVLMCLLLLTGCTAKIPMKQHYEEINDLYTNISYYRNEVSNFLNNATECIEPEEYPECINKDYLSLEEYQTMSMRIKWLEKRLDGLNNSDRTIQLEENYTKVYDQFKGCNETLTTVKEALE